MFIQTVSINRWSTGSKPSGSVTFNLDGGSITQQLSDDLINTFEQLAIVEYQTKLRARLEAALDKPVLTFRQEEEAKALVPPRSGVEDADFSDISI